MITSIKPVSAMSRAFEWILKTEGGYVNNPNDKGGETNYGISKRQYPDLDIANLTIEEALEIYRVDYYDAYRCGELPEALGLFLFDSIVNHGAERAVRFLQYAVKSTVDGLIGPKTIAKANLHSKNINQSEVLRDMSLQRVEFYKRLVYRRPSQNVFLTGWQKRVLHLNEFIRNNNLIGQ